MPNTKSFSDLWHEAIYTAHVNFLRKRDLFEDWKKFKAGKKLRQDDPRLMSEFIKICAAKQEKSRPQESSQQSQE